MSETTGPTNFSTVTGVIVTNPSGGWTQVSTTTGTLGGNFTGTSSGSLTVYLAAGNNISSGQAITVTVINVTNPGAGTYSDFSITTSGNPVSAAVPAYTIGASGVLAPQVVVTPNSTGSVATYTINRLYAISSITGGSTEVTLTAPSGTVFPNVSADYMVTDSTASSGSGTFTLTSYLGNVVTLLFPNDITTGDALVLTITDAINPSVASSTYAITLAGEVGAATTATFPSGNTSYPNGALVNFSGTIYVFAGGHAFGIPTEKRLAEIRAVNKATILTAATGATVPTSPPRSGTLLRPLSGTTIYTVDSSGVLHGFSTPAQYVSYGYDTRLNVTVPNTTGLTIGTTAGVAGSAANALNTVADGAVVNSSGTFFTFAGGKAFGIPTEKALAAIRKTNSATTLTGTVGTTLTSATLTSGVLVTSDASSPVTVYATYIGFLWPFKTMSQLTSLGYGGTASVPIWGLGGVSVVSTYTIPSSSSSSTTTTT